MLSHDLLTYAILCGSALLAGAINSVAGGGTLLTFPALMAALAVLGEEAGVLANGTSTIALLPGSLAGAWGYRREIAENRPTLKLLLWPCLLGGMVGALLVTRFPGRIFNGIVPWLILLATFLFLLQGPVKRWTKTQHHETPSARTIFWILIFQFFVALYGGYFGAGIGILTLTALSFMAVGDIHRMNGLKTILASAINLTSVVVFVAEGKVIWTYAAAMSIASIVGGFAGAHWSRKLPAAFVRGLVIGLGFVLSIYYFWREFLA